MNTSPLENDQDFVLLQPELLSSESQALQNGLLNKIVGQERAVKQTVRSYQTFRSGLQRPNRPIGVLLFLGPTGSGKTRLVEALAECIFGRRDAMIKIDCAEFQADHEISKIIGSPAGYLGHKSTPSRITQELLDKYHTPTLKMSILLLDEIEKASEALYQMMLGVLDRGELTLGSGEKVSLTNTLIIMTSNEGSSELQKIVDGSGLGFSNSYDPVNIDNDIWTAAKEALKDKFTPEFRNRIDRTIVFRQLDEAALSQIVDIELEGVQNRILMAGHFVLLHSTNRAKLFLTKKGTDPVCGAREINRAIERYVIEPISNLLATKQVLSRDLLRIDFNEGDQLIFTKLENVIQPPPAPHYEDNDPEIE